MKRIERKVLLFLLMLLLWSDSQASDFTLSGYYKTFSVALFPASLKTEDSVIRDPAMGSVSARIRLKADWKIDEWLIFQAGYDFSPILQDPKLMENDLFFAEPGSDLYRWKDFSKRIYPGRNADSGSVSVEQNLDRLFLQFRFKGSDLTVGRQVVAWGSSRVINPTDVIAPFAFHELDAEERRGVDAARLRIPIGALNELDMGWVSGANGRFGENAFFIKGKVHLLETDCMLLLLSFRRHRMIGVDFSRSLFGAGFWMEAAYVKNHTDESTGSNQKDYFRLSTGLDASLNPFVYAFVEYHFNSAGSRTPSGYWDLFAKPSFMAGNDYFLGRHYLSLGVTWQITPLVPFAALCIGNLNDGSVMVAPSLEYNISQNIYLKAGAYFGIGKRAETAGMAGGAMARSEFGAYPQMLYSSFRIYF